MQPPAGRSGPWALTCFIQPAQNLFTRTMNQQTVPDMLKHPLQRLQSPSRTLSLALHIVGLCSFAKSFEYLQTHPNPINQSYGWHFQFLTILGMFVSLAKLII